MIKMTPAEKAFELVDRFHHLHFPNIEIAKQCALICVEEILFLYKKNGNIESKYWQEAKKEIEKF